MKIILFKDDNFTITHEIKEKNSDYILEILENLETPISQKITLLDDKGEVVRTTFTKKGVDNADSNSLALCILALLRG